MAKLCASAGRGGMVVWAQGKAGSSVGHAPTPCASLARRLLIVFHEELISDPQGVMRATHSFLHLAASRSHARRTRHRASAEDTMLRASGAQLFNVTAATATSLRQMMSDSVAKVHHQLQTARMVHNAAGGRSWLPSGVPSSWQQLYPQVTAQS